jgi:hypothetical protein
MESPVRRLLGVAGALLIAGSSAWGQAQQGPPQKGPQQKGSSQKGSQQKGASQKKDGSQTGSSQSDNISACSQLAYEPAANVKRRELFARCSKAPRADCESVREIFKQENIRDAGLACTGQE